VLGPQAAPQFGSTDLTRYRRNPLAGEQKILEHGRTGPEPCDRSPAEETREEEAGKHALAKAFYDLAAKQGQSIYAGLANEPALYGCSTGPRSIPHELPIPDALRESSRDARRTPGGETHSYRHDMVAKSEPRRSTSASHS
jgi:hypothetical protein